MSVVSLEKLLKFKQFILPLNGCEFSMEESELPDLDFGYDLTFDLESADISQEEFELLLQEFDLRLEESDRSVSLKKSLLEFDLSLLESDLALEKADSDLSLFEPNVSEQL